jgi:ribosome recycling factor
MIEKILHQHKLEFEKVLTHLQTELSTLRTGRANVGLLAAVRVESYGAKLPLTQVASVTASDPKTLTITPWDKSQIQAIEKGIMAANLGFNPASDGNVIRVNIPPMTEERRKELVKLVGQMAESARVGIRQVREEVIKQIKRAEAAKEIGEDDSARGQKKLQELVDRHNASIKQMAEEKEKEIMTI